MQVRCHALVATGGLPLLALELAHNSILKHPTEPDHAHLGRPAARIPAQADDATSLEATLNAFDEPNSRHCHSLMVVVKFARAASPFMQLMQMEDTTTSSTAFQSHATQDESLCFLSQH